MSDQLIAASEDRSAITVTGPDSEDFLQGLLSNHLPDDNEPLVYAALLTPQGKYLVDFFVCSIADGYLIDVARELSQPLLQRLNMYKLRADVQLDLGDIEVARGLDAPPVSALPDPRHPELGWRSYEEGAESQEVDWLALRVAHAIPESLVELIPNESYPLEMGFERLNGIDFRKGCYVGQEVTARMKHKTELRKGLAKVAVEGSAPVGSEISANGKAVGTLFSQTDGQGLAYLRFDRAGPDMRAGGAKVSWTK